MYRKTFPTVLSLVVCVAASYSLAAVEPTVTSSDASALPGITTVVVPGTSAEHTESAAVKQDAVSVPQPLLPVEHKDVGSVKDPSVSGEAAQVKELLAVAVETSVTSVKSSSEDHHTTVVPPATGDPAVKGTAAAAAPQPLADECAPKMGVDREACLIKKHMEQKDVTPVVPMTPAASPAAGTGVVGTGAVDTPK